MIEASEILLQLEKNLGGGGGPLQNRFLKMKI
jgi:hypothetical protein